MRAIARRVELAAQETARDAREPFERSSISGRSRADYSQPSV
jgi:hypothetical protein